MLPKLELAPMRMYLTMLAKTRRPLHDPFFQNQKAFLQQNDVRGFLGHVHGRVDRNPDIGSLEGGRIIDPVPHEAHHMASLAQGTNNLLFLSWAEFDEDILFENELTEFLRRELGQFRPCYHPLRFQSDVGTDPLRDQAIIAGKHLDPDTGFVQELQRFVAEALGGSKKAI